MSLYKSIVCLPLVFILYSCGYHLAEPSLYQTAKSIAVPFVEGDLDGRLTSELVQSITSLTPFQYVSNIDEADLILKARIVKHDQYNIGYQYDVRDSTQDIINRLVPNEARKEIVVEFTIIDGANEKILKGPYQVKAFTDYDFVNSDTYKALSFVNAQGIRRSVLAFSLGQLDSTQGASDIALDPIYKFLAIKIAQGLEKL